MSPMAQAAGTVSYDGDAKEFVFSTDGSGAPSELFTAFKNVMPGDTITQDLSVVSSARGQKVRIYLRAVPAKAEDTTFLSQLHLNVVQNSSDGQDKILFDAQADQPATLEEWTLLGTFFYGNKTDLTLTLSVPIQMGNEFQDAAATLSWEFMAEVYSLQPGDPGYKTGDMYVLPILGAIFLTSLFMLFLFNKKRKEEND